MILWIISRTYFVYLLPQKMLKGKFKIIKREFRIFHANYYNYRSRKDRLVSENRLNSIKRIINKELNNNKKIDVIIKRLHRNNFIFTKQ